MQLSNREVLLASKSIQAITMQVAALPVAAAFKLAVNLKALSAVEETYHEARQTLAESHAKKDDDGKPVTETVEGGNTTFVLEDEAVFAEALDALLATQSDVPVQPFSIDAFGDVEMPVGPLVALVGVVIKE